MGVKGWGWMGWMGWMPMEVKGTLKREIWGACVGEVARVNLSEIYWSPAQPSQDSRRAGRHDLAALLCAAAAAAATAIMSPVLSALPTSLPEPVTALAGQEPSTHCVCLMPSQLALAPAILNRPPHKDNLAQPALTITTRPWTTARIHVSTHPRTQGRGVAW